MKLNMSVGDGGTGGKLRSADCGLRIGKRRSFTRWKKKTRHDCSSWFSTQPRSGGATRLTHLTNLTYLTNPNIWTRTGKIARLPKNIREQVNQRLDDGEQGASLVAWLNSLPEAQTVLARDFDGKAIREQNLSEWRKGGYRDWKARCQLLEIAQRLQTGAA